MEYTVSMVKTLGEFLKSKGGVGLLVVLQNRGKTYSEIEPDVLITSSTISTRLDDACDLGVVEIIPARRHGRTLNEYHLTDFGEAVVQDLAMRGVVSNYRDMRTHYQSMKEKTEGSSRGFTRIRESTRGSQKRTKRHSLSAMKRPQTKTTVMTMLSRRRLRRR